MTLCVRLPPLYTLTMISSSRAIAVVIAACGALYILGRNASAQSSPSATKSKQTVGLSAKKLNFGKVLAETQGTSQMVTLTNKSNAQLAAPVVNVTGTGFNLESNGCQNAIPAMGNCPVSVNFTPPSKGKFKALLTFTDAAAKSPQKVKLSGVGLTNNSPAFNVVFVTSTSMDGNLGGQAGADTECATLATAAHLPAGAYKAWLSTSTLNAVTKLGSARGFIRTDGAPFADRVTDIADGKILNSLNFDENGSDVQSMGAWSGTADAGTTVTGFTCLDWTSNLNSYRGADGITTWGPGGWSDQFGSPFGGPCNVLLELYCFDTSHVTPLTYTPAAGRIAFVSKAKLDTTSGVAGADALCQSEATAAGLTNPSHFLALLSTSTVSAASRFDLSAMSMPYVRPDGIKIADAATIEMDAALDSGIWQNADGTYENSTVWTGSTSPTSTGATDCNDWSTNSSGTMGIGALSGVADPRWWLVGVDGSPAPCDNSLSVYCLEE